VPFAVVSGTRLHHLDVGTGEPAVVLLHAFPLNADMWDEQLDALSPRWRVIAPDLPGFGRTDPPADPRSATIDHWADLVAGLIESLGVGPAVVGGLSMGGYVALALARRRPDLLAGLVLADTRAASDTPEVAERRTVQQRQVSDGQTAEVIESMLGTLLSEQTRAERTDVVERARALMTTTPPPGLVAALEAMKNRSDATSQLPSIDVPVLVIVGEHDVPSPPPVATAIAEAVSGSFLEVIPTAGHLSNLEAPEAFNRALETFLSRP